MRYPTRLKLIPLEQGLEVLCEILHPMESGNQGDRGGAQANYITQVVIRLNNQLRAEFFLGKFVSRHPVIGTVLTDTRSGDRITVSWQDLSGDRGQASATVQ